MKKMPCLFVREFESKDSFTITDVVSPGCDWVLAGEGVPSIKRDGTACMFTNGQLYKRYDAKKDKKTGEYKAVSDDAISCGDPDEETGHWPHWIPIAETDYWHQEALARQKQALTDGATYELCGPKISANPEELQTHILIKHGVERVALTKDALTFMGLRAQLDRMNTEGIVFAHPDGRRAKIRRKDFGFAWPLEKPKAKKPTVEKIEEKT